MQPTTSNSTYNDKFIHRSQQFMQTADIQTLRKRNEDYAIKLRKQKRNENFNKRRFIEISNEELPSEELVNLYPELKDLNLTLVNSTQDRKIALFYSIITTIEDTALLEKAIIYCRKMISSEPSIPSEIFVNHGFVKLCVDYSDMKKYSKIIVVRSNQHNASWILCNIAGGATESNLSVCNSGGMELFHTLLQTSDKDYFDIALYGLANIAGEHMENRNKLLDLGVLNTLVDKYTIAKEFDLLENYGFCLRNIVRYRYEFNEQNVNDILDVVMQTLEFNCSDEITQQFLEVIGCLVFYSEYALYIVSTESYLDILIGYYSHTIYEIQEKVHKIIASIATGSNEMTQNLLNKQILDKEQFLLSVAKSPLRKEIAWLMSNIAVGTHDQISELLSHSIFPYAMKFLRDADLSTKKEATYIFYNIGINGDPDQIIKLVSLGVLEYLKDALNDSDPKCVLVISIQNILSFTRALLKAGDDLQVNSLKFMMESSGCIDILEKLLSSRNKLISERAFGIVKDFITLEEESEELKETLQAIQSEFEFS